MIDGSQMTICFHVDDCKLSHVKPKVMDDMIAWLKKEYESIFKDGSGQMTVSRGKTHKYLGMNLDYSAAGQVKITMFDYIEEILTTSSGSSGVLPSTTTTTISSFGRYFSVSLSTATSGVSPSSWLLCSTTNTTTSVLPTSTNLSSSPPADDGDTSTSTIRSYDCTSSYRIRTCQQQANVLCDQC
jgi:hypothetical protein